MNALALEQKADGRHALALAFAKSIHELLKLRTTLNLEEDFIIVVGHLDVQVLGASSGGLGALAGGATAFVLSRHCGGSLRLM